MRSRNDTFIAHIALATLMLRRCRNVSPASLRDSFNAQTDLASKSKVKIGRGGVTGNFLTKQMIVLRFLQTAKQTLRLLV